MNVGGQVLHTSCSSATELTNELQQLKTFHGDLRGIIHLSGLQLYSPDDTATAFLEIQTDRCALAAAIVKATEATEITTTCWLITTNAASHLIPRQGSQQPNYSVRSLPDAALWGFGRTLINETASGTIHLVDLETPGNLEALIEAVAKEIIQPDNEQEICISSDGKRFAPRLQLIPHNYPEMMISMHHHLATAWDFSFQDNCETCAGRHTHAPHLKTMK